MPRGYVFAKNTGSCSGGQASPSGEPTNRTPGRVETYSGFRLHERPRRFTYQGEGLEVRRVLAQWQEPEALCFTVAAEDARVYLLKYHPDRDAWEVRIWRDADSPAA
jgi:hypothetical protein